MRMIKRLAIIDPETTKQVRTLVVGEIWRAADPIDPETYSDYRIESFDKKEFKWAIEVSRVGNGANTSPARGETLNFEESDFYRASNNWSRISSGGLMCADCGGDTEDPDDYLCKACRYLKGPLRD